MSDLLISVKIPGQVWAWLTSEFGLEPNATLHDVVINGKEMIQLRWHRQKVQL